MKWPAKILIKVLLSRLPVSYAWWSRLGIFRHGRMDDADYALSTFRSHVSRAFPHGLPKGATILEVGPGDSIASALLGYAHGVSACLVDVGPFADRRIDTYKRIAADLAEQGLDVPSLDGARSLDDVLAACGARYLTNGVDSLRQLPSGSVDFVWSQAVLANVRKADLAPLVAETRRILKPGGLASHSIDFRDHLDRGLNALRFPEWAWEWDFLAHSGFYTNRVRAGAMRRLFEAAGFEVALWDLERWPSLPIARNRLDAEFRGLSEGELTVIGSRSLLRAPALRSAASHREDVATCAGGG